MTYLRRNYRYIILSLLSMLLAFSACVPEGIELPCRIESVITYNPTSVTASEAKLNGLVSLYDTDTISCGIIYDTSSSLSSKNATMKSTAANGKYSVSIDGLKANTTYHYRAYAVDAGVYKFGKVLSFKTDISVVTGEAVDITDSGVKLCGEVSSADKSIVCGFIYGTSSVLSVARDEMISIESTGKYSIALSDLKPNTTYYYVAYALVDGSYKYGEVRSFSTTASEIIDVPEVTVTTGDATDITCYSASLNGVVSGVDEPVECGFIYGLSSDLFFSNGGVENGVFVYVDSLDGYSLGIIELDANTTYYYRAYAYVNGEFKYGEVRSFTTEAKAEISVITGNATDIIGTSVTLNGTVVGANESVECGFVYGVSSDLSTPVNGGREYTSSTGDYSLTVPVYDPNTTYYYCAFVITDGECKYGEVCTFTSDIFVKTLGADKITENSARLSGDVCGVDNDNLTCGFLYGMSSELSLLERRVENNYSLHSTMTYFLEVSDLIPNTTYYYCAYTVIDGEYKYGEIRSFTTQQVANEPVEGINVYTVNGVSFKMIEVEGGTFTMGSPASDSDADSDEMPAHQVTLNSYYIGETEVTQALWQAVMGSNPSYFTGELQRPVEQVSWYDCQTFISKLNELTGENFCLPTEAEWEYAARGGKESIGYKNSSSNGVGGVTLYGMVSRETNVVKSMEPNELGIYEMLGNVWEWCSDWYGSYSSSAQTNPTGPSSGTYRVLRGGGNFAGDMYVANREPNSPAYRYKFNGLRLAISSTERDNTTITVTTGEATNITFESATLSGVVVGATDEISCGIIYDTSPDMSSSNGDWMETFSNGAYSIDISGLKPGTTYYYCAYLMYLTEDGGEERVMGEILSFTTSELPAPSKTYTVNGVSFKMIEVEGGTFTMGSPDSDSDAWNDEKPIHQVTLSSYCIGETEVTQALWQAVMGSNPSSITGDLQRPVEQVSWNDCQTFISKLKELTGENFCLPTEAEWEYAARGGNKSRGYLYSGSNTIDDVALYQEDLFAAVRTNAVKTKKPNELGIYDMSGNVYEWCFDWYGEYSSSSQTNPIGPSSGSIRVLRGGSWCNYAKYSRVACRSNGSPDFSNNDRGLRLAISSTERGDALQEPITVTTGEATNITSESATLSGVVVGATGEISCGIIYGTSSDISSSDNNRVGTSSDGAYSIDVSYLQPGTTYYYCAYTIDEDGESEYGDVLSFTTLEAYKTYTVNGVSFTMIGVDGGTFTMGSPDSDPDAEDDEKPAHQVTLSSYYIGETEVTQALWQAVMGSDYSDFTGDLQCPVDNVYYSDCETFISKLNELTGENFSLPTEAEWEYAARGGKKSKGYKYSGSNEIDDVAWYSSNSSSTMHPVKTKQPNELGIYDMSGNVDEWCYWIGSYSSSNQTDPTPPRETSVGHRGGHYNSNAERCRVAHRSEGHYKFSNSGLRLYLKFMP